MGGSPKSSTVRNEPPAYLQPYYEQGADVASEYFEAGPNTFYPGLTYAPDDPATQAAKAGQTFRALSGSPLNPIAQGYTGSTAAGQGLYADPSMGGYAGFAASPGVEGNAGYNELGATAGGDFLGGNPQFGAVADSIRREVEPAVASSFAAAGRGGSPLHSAAVAKEMTSALAPYAYGNYESERGRQVGAQSQRAGIYEGGQNRQLAGLGGMSGTYGRERGLQADAARFAPELAREDYYDASKLAEVGASNEDLTERAIADAMGRFGSTQPSAGLEHVRDFIGSLTAIPGGQTTQPVYGSPIAQGLGGAASLASIASSVPGIGK